MAVVEMTIVAGAEGPPLHVHAGHGEGFYVLAGELVVRAGEEIATAPAGSFAYAPAGVPHTFANWTERDARVLVLCAPAGFERYFDALAAGIEGPPPEDAISVGPPLDRSDPLLVETAADGL